LDRHPSGVRQSRPPQARPLGIASSREALLAMTAVQSGRNLF